jgi:hypothetical protein
MVDIAVAIANAPMVRLGRQPLTMHEGAYDRMLLVFKHAFRGSPGDHGFRLSVQKDPIIANP